MVPVADCTVGSKSAESPLRGKTVFTCDFELGTVSGFGNRRRKEEGKPLWGPRLQEAFGISSCSLRHCHPQEEYAQAGT